MNIKRKKRRARRKRLLGNIIGAVIIIALAFGVSAALVSHAFKNNQYLLGFRGYIDLSGDMSPAIKKGSLIIIKRVDPNTIRKGDIITYTEGSDTLTERVTETVNDNGNVSFITKADADQGVNARAVSAGAVTGKFVRSISSAGSLMLALRNPAVIWLGVFGVFAVIIAFDVYHAWTRKRLRRNKRGKRRAAGAIGPLTGGRQAELNDTYPAGIIPHI